MTEDEVRTLNRMSARLTAAQFALAWLLYKDLKQEPEPDTLMTALLAKAQEAADTSSGQTEEFRAAFVEEFRVLLDQSARLLARR